MRSAAPAEVKRARLALWLILTLAAGVRLIPLGRQSLWLDEATSYWVARLSALNMIAYLWTNDPHGPLYYLMLRPMIALGGSEWLLRLPSALTSIASVALLYALGAELFTRYTGLLAAFIFALSPIQIWYAQEARMYALVVMLTLAAGWFAVRALRRNRALDWAMLAVCQGLALLTDTSGIWFTLAINTAALLAIFWLWRSGRFWSWVASQAAAVIPFMPWLPAFLRAVRDGSAGWIPPATLIVLVRTVADFAGSYERPTLEAAGILLIFFGGFALGARYLIRDALKNRVDYLLLGCWLVVPVGLAFLLSQPYVRPALVTQIFGPGRSVFLTRNLIVAACPLYLLLARSLTLSSHWALRAVFVALVALNGWAYFGNTIPPKKPDFRAAAKIVAEQAAAKDVIVFVPFFLKEPFSYYYQGANPFLASTQDFENGLIAATPGRTYLNLMEALKDNRRAWLITSANIYYTDPQNAAATVEASGQLLQRLEFFDVTVSLYDLGTASK